jgi:hypothetical protein
MKNILTLIAVLFISAPAYAQDLNVTTNIKVEDKSLEVEREKAIREAIKISEGKIANERKAEGVFYLGNGQYKIVKIGRGALAGIKTLGKRIEKEIKVLSAKYNLKYELIDSQESKKLSGQQGVQKLELTYKLYSMDGSLALNENLGIIKLSDEQIKENEIQTEENKDKAIKKLKELKELLDMDLITKDEFDKESFKLKKIILGN